MPKIGDLSVSLSAKTNKFVADFEKANKSITRIETSVAGLSKKMIKTGQVVNGFGALLVTAFSSKIASGIFETSRMFESLEASLSIVTGSAKEAKKAMSFVDDFSNKTPFSIEQVANAFIKLKAFGLDPGAKSLTAYGNTASVMGKSLDQMIEAVADSARFQFERLNEFGISAKQQAETVTFTFQGISTTVKKNSNEIIAFLQKIGNVEFAGAMSKQMDTLDGKVSNLKSSITRLYKAIGDEGATKGFKKVTDFLASLADKARVGIITQARTLKNNLVLPGQLKLIKILEKRIDVLTVRWNVFKMAVKDPIRFPNIKENKKIEKELSGQIKAATKSLNELKKTSSKIQKDFDAIGDIGKPNKNNDLVKKLKKQITVLKKIEKRASSADKQAVNPITRGVVPLPKKNTGAEKIQKTIEKISEVKSALEQLKNNTIENLSNGIGDAFANGIVYGENFRKSIKMLGKDLKSQVLSTLISIGVKQAILAAQSAIFGAKSTAQAAVQGPLIAKSYAPAAATTSIATFGASAVAGAAALFATFKLAQMLSGKAHGGLDNVPSTGTFLLEKGEAVIKSNQNARLQKFLDNQESSVAAQNNVTINIQAIDTQSGIDFIEQQKYSIVRMISDQFTNNMRSSPI